MKKIVFIIFLLFALTFLVVGYAEFEIHFLDVGDADAAIVVCDNEVMIIDAGEASHSQLIFSYLRTNLQINQVKYVIMSHPHDDHIGGIPAVLNACTVKTIFSPMHEYHSEQFQKIIKTANEQGLAITKLQYGDEFFVGNAHCRVVSPLEPSSNINNLSLVLLIEYGNNRFLFTGDMEKDAEIALLNTWEDIHADVLKVAHHGRATSSTHMFLRVVNADYYVVSGGSHLAASVHTQLSASGKVYITQTHGHIICHSDGEIISFSFLKSALPNETSDTHLDASLFIGNRNSKIFHHSWCDSVFTMAEKNKVLFPTRQEAMDNGYKGCERCTP